MWLLITIDQDGETILCSEALINDFWRGRKALGDGDDEEEEISEYEDCISVYSECDSEFGILQDIKMPH